MENSVIAESDSDAVIIEDSFVDASYSASKKSVVKNQTVFVAESEESEDTDAGDINIPRVSDSVARRSSAFEMKKTILSSDDDVSRAGSIRRKSDAESNKVISSSSDEDEMSPEVMPKRRPQVKNTRLFESFIGRKTKKRMVLDSDTDNSFIMEHRRRGKLACMKATPLKIGTDKVRSNAVAQMSFQDDDDQSDKSDSSDQNDSVSDENYSETENESDTDSRSKVKRKDKKAINESDESYSESEEKGNDSEKHIHSNNKVNKKTKKQIIESDESYSESEEEGNVSKKDIHSNSHGNTKYKKEVKESDERCSGSDEEDDVSKNDEDFSKEMRKEVGDSNERINGYDNRESLPEGTDHIEVNNYDDDGPDEDQMAFCRATRMSIMGFLPKENESDDSDYIQSDDTKHTSSLAKSVSDLAEAQEHNNNSPDKPGDSSGLTCSPIASPLRDDDDDVTIIDPPPEIIALSSDDEEVVIKDKKSPNTKKNKSRNDDENIKVEGSIKQFLVPASPPKQVVYVQKHVRENELAKLNGYKEELQNLRYLLDNMDMETLPDGGVKLIERLTALEGEVQRQADKVHGMVVAPDDAEGAISAGKAKKTPTWEDIQKASNAVQPRMFGKQAMATHMAERNLIMERLRDLHESLASRPSDETQAPAPAAVRSELMPHQLQALAWLRWRETQRPPGGILADDMGLGKTITMISLIAQDKEAGIDDDEDDDTSSRGRVIHGGTLVVCPASLLQQWAGEVGKHCAPHALSVAQHHGATRAQHPHRLAASDLVLTTYNILQRESDKSGVLTKVTWRRVILDEAHVVRNHKSATSNAVAALRARRRWALTGTPLHNKDLDLFALLKFLKCTPFDDLTMWKKWIDNKSMGGEERLSMIMRCLMLRRTKAQLQASGQLACLPERTAHERPVTLSKEEMNVYQKVLVTSKTLFAQFLHQRAEKQVDANGLTRMQKDNAYALHKKMAALRGVKPVKSHEILVLLLRLRQMCCHCGLISAMLSEEDDVQEDPAGQDLLAELNKLSLEDSRAARKSGGGPDGPDGEETGGKDDGASVEEAIRSVLSLKNPVFRLDRPSAKIAAVMDCLNNNVFPNKGEKAVVVSQWTSVLRLVERELRAARVRCTTLCGSVPVTARAALVDSLNDPQSDVRVMLLSLCAGGVGLNLCGASHLLLLDPHWNPQLEQQAQDRVYRVGQHRHVHIYRFMCVDTVEQSIRTLQAAKLELADNILTGARHAPASKLTIDDLKLLFNMGPNDAK